MTLKKFRKRLALCFTLLVATLVLPALTLAQKPSADSKTAQQPAADSKGPTTAGSANLSQAQIDEIVRKFTSKETQFRNALNEYAFKRDALIQEIGMGGQVIGELLQENHVDSWSFAAPAELKTMIFDELHPDNVRTMAEFVPCDLVHVTHDELLGHFSRVRAA